MIDTHSHIFLEEFDADRAEVVQRAQAAGVTQIVLPNVDATTIVPLLETQCIYPQLCRVAIGLHPTSVTKNYLSDLETVRKALDENPCVAVGEIGLDYYWDKTFATQQQAAFRTQVEWALSRNLPIIIHIREALDDALCILQDYRTEHLRGVFHSFTYTAAEAEKIFALGNFKLGINGIVTFKNAAWRDALPQIGIENLVLETDAPYLAPVPHRGKRNEPAFVACTAQRLAEVFGMTTAQVDDITTRNAKELFRL